MHSQSESRGAQGKLIAVKAFFIFKRHFQHYLNFFTPTIFYDYLGRVGCYFGENRYDGNIFSITLKLKIMKKIILITILLITAAGVIGAVLFGLKHIKGPAAQNQNPNNLSQSQDQEGIEFDKCVAAGKPVMESYPRQCSINGRTYKENIGNAIEKKDLVQATQPKPGSIITSPTTIIGQARGTWFFEARFPVVLLDENHHEIGRGSATAFSDWMTENFVPFEATFEFAIPTTDIGFLLLKKDNPSGDPAKDDWLEIPVRFVPLKTLPTGGK